MDPQFPNAPSMTPAPSARPTTLPAWPRAPRSLDAGRGAAWWGEGWRIFTASPALWIGIIVVIVLVSIVLNFIPIVGSIVLANEPRIDAGVLVVGGADLHEVLAACNGRIRRTRERLLDRFEWSIDDFKAAVEAPWRRSIRYALPAGSIPIACW